MRYGIITDGHSNIQALKKVLELLDNEVDSIICLGDIVGYNANPKECLDLVRRHKKIKHVIQGNHDRVIGYSNDYNSLSDFSADAKDGAIYSCSILDHEDFEYLKSLKPNKEIMDADFPFLISHGIPCHVDPDGYLLYKDDAQFGIEQLKNEFGMNLGFFGHTHIPTFISSNGDPYSISSDPADFKCRMVECMEQEFEIDPDRYYLINPGSIGQPRTEGITSYAIFDSTKRTVIIKNLTYDFRGAMDAIYEAGYSRRIAERLDPTDHIKQKLNKTWR